jgi:hypothetical protein
MRRAASVIPFYQFCEQVLGLELTLGQRVIAKVAFGDLQPGDLEGDEREIALEMFGGLLYVSPKAKRFVVMRLGRGSGKTTLCSAWGVYSAVCQHPGKIGPGDTPYVITIAPDLPTAKLSISMCREMIRRNPALERLVIGDEKQIITIRRPDGLQVKIEAFAASRGGATVRGRTILTFLLDEAEFFTSGEGYTVSDGDIFRALKPRLVRHGKGMLVSTPWPVETLMGTMFEKNWQKGTDATAIKAPTLLVRGDDEDVRANVEDERERDPENCRREYDCEIDGINAEGWFDGTCLASAKTSELLLPGPYNPLWPTVAAADLAFKNDSSTLCVAQYDGYRYRTVALVEMRPSPGKPLKPSVVMNRFAEVAKAYGCSYIVADGHYRESFKEALAENGMALVDAPEGLKGKQESFSRVRAVLHEGLVLLPDDELTVRLIQQAKLVTAKPAPGGGLTIKVPRKVGLGHGDLVSAWVVAIHRLAYGQVSKEKVELKPNTPEYNQEVQRRLNAYYEKQNEKSLRAAEREVKLARKGRRNNDGVTFGR